MITPSGGIPTICYCAHHIFDHRRNGLCDRCACTGFVMKASFPWRPGESALVPAGGRYRSDDVKEDTDD